MAVADGGGNLPVIGRAPAHHTAGAAPNTVAPPSLLPPDEMPRPNSHSTPATPDTTFANLAAGLAAPSSPTELVRVTTPSVTGPSVGTNPRPEPAPATSPPAPPNQTPPKHQFGGPGIAGARGSGRGLGHVRKGGGAGGTKKGNNGNGNGSGNPSGSAAGVNPNKGNGNQNGNGDQNGNGGNSGNEDGDAAAPSHASACTAPGKSDHAGGCSHSDSAPRRPSQLRKSHARHPRAD
jgi:hypothetical protein